MRYFRFLDKSPHRTYRDLSSSETSKKSAEFLQKRVVRLESNGDLMIEERKGHEATLESVILDRALLNQKMALTSEVLFSNLSSTAEFIENYPSKNSVVVNELPFYLLPTAKGLSAIYRVEDFVLSRFKCKEVYKGEQLAFSLCSRIKGEDYAKAFAQLKEMGVQNLILDLRSNGGGFLDTGYELARSLVIQNGRANFASLRLNEEWMSEFKMMSELSTMPAQIREGYLKNLKILESDAKAQKKYSSPVSIFGSEFLYPVETPWNGKTIVLVDEMCASTCDVFATLLQDLKVGFVMGQQTMGAGGNIIGVGMTPHTKVELTLTASRMMRLDGRVIENEGAKPDVALPITDDSNYWNEVKKVIESKAYIY